MIAPKEIVDPNAIRRKIRGNSVLGVVSTTPSNYLPDLTEMSTITQTSKKHYSPGKQFLPEIVHPTQIIPKLHNKTHFKAATSVFMNHHGTLKHHDDSKDETGRHIEKILNDHTVKSNL